MVRHAAGIGWIGLFAMSFVACSSADNTAPEETPEGSGGASPTGSTGGTN